MSNYRIYLSKTIIVASKDAKDAEMDKKTLKSVGYTNDIQVFTSGIELALFLVDIDISHLERHYIILCNPKLKDMSASDFIELMRLHPLNAHQPLIAMSTNPNETTNFEEKGFTKVLQRPVSMQLLEDALTYCTRFEQQKRKQLEQLLNTPDFYFSSKEFFARLTEYQKEDERRNPDLLLEKLSPAQALYAGYDLLRDKNINKAITALMKALSDEAVVPQASLALASAYALAGKQDLVRKYLAEAIQGFAFVNNDEKMLELTGRFKKRFAKLEHPFLSEAQRYIDEDRLYDFMVKMQLINEHYPVEEESMNLARICLKNREPKELAKRMGEGLSEELQWIGGVIVTSVERILSGKDDDADPKKVQKDGMKGADVSGKKPLQASLNGKPEKNNTNQSANGVGMWKPQMSEKQREEFLDSAPMTDKNILANTQKEANYKKIQANAGKSAEAKNTDNRQIAEKKSPSISEMKQKGEELPDFGEGLSAPPRITMFDEGQEKVFLEKEDNSPLAWQVIKSTANAYKKAKK